MSGICFITHLDGSPVPSGHLEAMIAAAPYRGADGLGRWSGASRMASGGAGASAESVPDAAVVYQALYVTPESTLERQPLVDDRRGLVLAADVRLDDRDA